MSKKKQKKDNELEKITSNTMKRGLSFLNMTLASGARIASYNVSKFFISEKEKKRKLEEFMKKHANYLVDELGKLKGSVMKAGQMLSVYGEHFLPEDVNRILKKLQADSRPVVWQEMYKVMTHQIGDEQISSYLDIQKKAIAAASMGQVYKAKYKKSNQDIVLKVQYPGVDKAIDSDLKALKKILQLSKLVSLGQSFDDVFKEIQMMLHYEVDYSRELETIEKYRTLLKDDSRFIIPKTYPEISSKRVLAMSFETGYAIDSKEVLSISQERRNKLATAMMDLMFKEIFEWRLVQTDPHFGNYKIQLAKNPDEIDKIVLLDFGAVRKFPIKYIKPFAQLVNSAITKDKKNCIRSGLNLTLLTPEDSKEVLDLFCDICFEATEAFDEKFISKDLEKGYDWGASTLMQRLSKKAKDAIFTFKLRTPPREAVFLDRKMVGIYVILTTLKLKFGPKELISKYLTPYLD